MIPRRDRRGSLHLADDYTTLGRRRRPGKCFKIDALQLLRPSEGQEQRKHHVRHHFVLGRSTCNGGLRAVPMRQPTLALDPSDAALGAAVGAHARIFAEGP
jgi:hypothetical protein